MKTSAGSSQRPSPAPSSSERAALKIKASPHLTAWLHEQKISLAFTTYQTGKLFLIGLQPDGQLSVFERSFRRAMGLWSDGQAMWMASLFQLWRFHNALHEGEKANESFDRMYVPRVGYTTGAVDAHDIAADATGSPVFAATRYSCLATVSETHSFKPLWQPPFISALEPEDRCHLNGLAMRDGKAAYVTTCAETDAAEAWRDRRVDGGCVIDVQKNQVICRCLTMPHSPRWHDGRLWMLDSGRGYLGCVDLKSGRFERVCFCPGYARGLAFQSSYAIVALSLGREQRSFGDLPLESTLKSLGTEPVCGLMIIDLRTGQMVHWLVLEGAVRELYDVTVLPGVRQPLALGFKTNEIERAIALEPTDAP